MKNVKKINLNDLKVESFVTSIDAKDTQTVKAGGGATILILPVSIIVAGMAVVSVVGLSVGIAVEYYVPLAPKAEKK